MFIGLLFFTAPVLEKVYFQTQIAAMFFFDLDEVLFIVWDYPMSFIELFGTLTGLITVWLAARNNIYTWPFSLINVTSFFIIFWQVQLYADMLLQLYFFAMSIYGWIFWYRQKDKIEKLRILNSKTILISVILIVISVYLLGVLISNIHLYYPSVFEKPAAYPYWDAFTSVLSIVASVWMARRIIESWILWILVDIVAIALYFLKGIKLVSIEYIIFLLMSTYGLIIWIVEYKRELKELHEKLH